MLLNEKFCSNFEDICVDVFKFLDLESLIKCKSVSRSWYNVIERNPKVYKHALLNNAAENSHEDWVQIFRILDWQEIENFCFYKNQVDIQLKNFENPPFFYFTRLDDTSLFNKVWPILKNSQFFKTPFSENQCEELLTSVIKVTDDSIKFEQIFEFMCQKTEGSHDVIQHMMEIQMSVHLKRENIMDYFFKTYPRAVNCLYMSAMDNLDDIEKVTDGNIPRMQLFHKLAINGDFKQFKKIFEFQPIGIQFQNPKSDIIYCTPLHLATWKGHFEICRFIMENTRNLELEVLEECYILSVRYGHFNIFDLFHEELKNKNPARLHSTALHKAVKHNRPLMFEKIIKSVQCLFERDGFGQFPLDYAIQGGDMKITESIMNKLFSSIYEFTATDFTITKIMLQKANTIAVDNSHFKLAKYIDQSLTRVKSFEKFDSQRKIVKEKPKKNLLRKKFYSREV